jgi:hypothetical protein
MAASSRATGITTGSLSLATGEFPPDLRIAALKQMQCRDEAVDFMGQRVIRAAENAARWKVKASSVRPDDESVTQLAVNRS